MNGTWANTASDSRTGGPSCYYRAFFRPDRRAKRRRTRLATNRHPATEQEHTMDQFAIFASERAPYFVGWGTLMLINAGLAQGKNRSGLLWFLLTLILGPLATLLIVVMPKVRGKMF
jgi:hypothetical protein